MASACANALVPWRTGRLGALPSSNRRRDPCWTTGTVDRKRRLPARRTSGSGVAARHRHGTHHERLAMISENTETVHDDEDGPQFPAGIADAIVKALGDRLAPFGGTFLNALAHDAVLEYPSVAFCRRSRAGKRPSGCSPSSRSRSASRTSFSTPTTWRTTPRSWSTGAPPASWQPGSSSTSATSWS